MDLCKERVLTGEYHKLKYKKIGPIQILQKINDNTYIIDLLETYEISRHSMFKIYISIMIANLYLEPLKDGFFLRGEN